MTRRLALIASAVLTAAALAGGRAQAVDFPSLVVVFHSNGTVTVAFPDGTPVGVTSGTPTVIAPGIYNVLIDDSAFMSNIEFDLAGPGVKLVTDASRGESPSETWVETFLPSSTYTWRDDAGRRRSGPSSPRPPAASRAAARGRHRRSRRFRSRAARTGRPSSTDIVGSESTKAALPRHARRRRERGRQADADPEGQGRRQPEVRPLHLLGHGPVEEGWLHRSGDPEVGRSR